METEKGFAIRRVVVRMAGPAAETLRLFDLFVREHGNVSIAEVK